MFARSKSGRSSILPVLLLIGLAISCVDSAAVVDLAIDEVRTRYFDRDFTQGYEIADRLLESHPGSDRLRAWRILAAARSRRHDAAIADAETLTTVSPDSPWAWFALAGALHNDRNRMAESLAASERALEMSTHPDILWMRAQTLARFGEPEVAVALVDAQEEPDVELLNVKAYATYLQAFGSAGDPAKIDEALAQYRSIRSARPDNLGAAFQAGDMLHRRRRSEEAIPFLEDAVRLAPASPEPHEMYWYALLGLDDLDQEAKRELIEADIARYFAADADPAARLLVLSGLYGELGEAELATETEEELLAEYADRPEAESVLVGRHRALRPQIPLAEADPEQITAYRNALRDFLDLPARHRKVFLGEAYARTFDILEIDADATDDEIAEAAFGMIEYDTLNPHSTYTRGAVVLAQRTGRYRDAEAIARRGIDAVPAYMETMRALYDTDGAFQNGTDFYLSLMHDALGEVFVAEGRLDDAEAAFLEAHEINPNNRDNLFHLGQLAESRGQIEEAESFYVLGLAVQRQGTNPNQAALEALFAKRSDGGAGFEDYLAGIRRADAERRKVEVIDSRIVDPEPAPGFALRDMHGDIRTLADHAGRVVVINFWGIWCGPCVSELPDLQTFHERYAEDPEIVVLTINNDQRSDEVAPWMAEHDYTMNVLFDDGYVGSVAGVNSYPTTWFLDRAGRVAFIKRGWSQELVDEFSWRVEALRADQVTMGVRRQ